MIIAIGIIIFLVGCIVSSVEDSSASAQRLEARRHEELMKLLSNTQRKTPTVTKVTRRRVAQDKEGNVLAEEITEETV